MSDAIGRLGAALAERYRIERELGQGGMATVYLAEDLKHKRKVALKVLKPELAAVLGAERFVQEITTTAALQHPHILPLFDSGRTDGQTDGRTEYLYFVMPYVEGETLRDKLNRETQLGIEEAVRIASEVADALDNAHRHGVIHGDIKPENILLHDGRPMVADFGIALAVSAAAGGRMTETGLSLGTPHYMSPEQATADKEITARSDIYSLASVLYEMLAGNPPHVGSTAQQIIMKIISEPAAEVTKYRKSVPPNVAAALAKALEQVPADRFESAARFAEALQNPAYRSGAVPAGTRLVRRWNPVSIAATAVAVVMTGVAAWRWTRPAPEPSVLRYSMRLAAGEELSSIASVLGRRLALSQDGSQLAYVGSGGPSGLSKLWLRKRDELHANPLSGTDEARRPVFSPDGSRIAFFGADQSLWVVGIGGAPPRRVNEQDFSASGAEWGRDGYIYGARRRQGPGSPVGLIRICEDGGPVEAITTLDSVRRERTHQWPLALPGGRGVLFHIVLGFVAPFDQERLEVTGPAHAILDGVGVTALGVELAISDRGTLMYVSGTTGFAAQPVWVDRQGRAELIDPEWTYPTASLYSTVALSPDGSRLITSQSDATGQHLFVKQLPRGPNMQLTFAGSVNSRAFWTREGREILFVSDRSGVNQVWRQVADGSAPADSVAATPANEGLLSPDGEWFIYRGIAGDRHIYARRTGGDTAVIVVARSERGEDVAPSLSPDGKWIAYVSDESGRNEVYVRPFPDASRMKSQVSTSGGIEPRWSRDGKELHYRNEADQLVSATVAASGASFVVSERRELFSMNDYLPANVYQATYDVTPGGQRFILGKRVVAGGGMAFEQVIVVENFLSELRRTPTR